MSKGCSSSRRRVGTRGPRDQEGLAVTAGSAWAVAAGTAQVPRNVLKLAHTSSQGRERIVTGGSQVRDTSEMAKSTRPARSGSRSPVTAESTRLPAPLPRASVSPLEAPPPRKWWWPWLSA